MYVSKFDERTPVLLTGVNGGLMIFYCFYIFIIQLILLKICFWDLTKLFQGFILGIFDCADEELYSFCLYEAIIIKYLPPAR